MIFFTVALRFPLPGFRHPIDSAITAYCDVEKGRNWVSRQGKTVQALHMPPEGHSPSTGG